MKVEKEAYSNKLGVGLMVHLSEEDNLNGTNPCAPNTRIKVFIMTQEVDYSEKRFYENEYWILNDANKFASAFIKAFNDAEKKFLLDNEAKKAFEAISVKEGSKNSIGDLKINVDVVVNVEKARHAVNELLESMKFKDSNLK